MVLSVYLPNYLEMLLLFLLRCFDNIDISINQNGITVFTSKGTEVIPLIFQLSSSLEIKINSISLTQPSLDDVFISYTGRELRDDSDNFNKRREHAKMKRLRA